MPIIKSEAYWDYHFAVIQALYPLYCLLRLADMKEAGIDKVKYYVMQVDCLLDEGIGNICSKMESNDGVRMFKTLCQSLVVALPDPEEEKMPGMIEI